MARWMGVWSRMIACMHRRLLLSQYGLTNEQVQWHLRVETMAHLLAMVAPLYRDYIQTMLRLLQSLQLTLVVRQVIPVLLEKVTRLLVDH